MEKKSLNEVTKRDNYLKMLMSNSIVLPRQQIFSFEKEEGNFYRKFPQINQKSKKLELKLSDLIKKIGAFAGIEFNKGLVKLEKTVEIIEQYTDNVEILIKKFSEEQQKLRVKKRREGQNQGFIVIRPQEAYNLQKPLRMNKVLPYQFTYLDQSLTIIPSQPLTTPLNYVQSEQQFNLMLSILEQQKAIAIDLEHSDKSYTGITSLMQISTRNQDFIIDVFVVWSSMVKLNIVFNNPAILKIFHGADSDIIWLHRDFDLRISNMFDTHQAAKVLGHKQLSYAYLLKYYTAVQTDKKYQLADWRIRPLSEQMLLYARMDTHYLLEIYDRMKNDIYKKSIDTQMDFAEVLKSIFMKSYDICLMQYKQTNFKYCQPYLSTMAKYRALQPQFKVRLMEKLFQLRDQLARKEDENVNQFFPKKFLFEICDKKNFDTSEIALCLKKGSQKLKKYISYISNQLSELLTIHADEKMQLQINQIVVETVRTEDQIKLVDFSNQETQFYFQFRQIPMDFSELKGNFFHKKLLPSFQNLNNHQCPLQYIIEKYSILKQSLSQSIKQQQIKAIEPLIEVQEQKPEQVIYFPSKAKLVQKQQTNKFQTKITKKRKKQSQLQQKIRNKVNVYTYLQ